MNDTQPPPEDTEATDGRDSSTTATEEPRLDGRRLRTIAEVRRPTDDRLVAGVCTGVARYLDLDPVIVRIAFAVLTFVGGAGVILYAAAWFLLPTTESPSPAAEWFNLDDTEERVRTGGLVIALVVAVLAVVGDSGWGWSWGAPWGLLPLALLVYIFVVRPRRNAEEKRRSREWADEVAERSRIMGRDAGDRAAAAATSAVDDWQTARAVRKRERSGALTGLTLSLTVIAIAVTRLVADREGGTAWTTYVAVALTVVGLGVLLSTFVGDGGLLIALGLVLALLLALGSVLPSPRVGEQTIRPTSASEVKPSYEHGVGQLTLDLTSVQDPENLVGRTISLENGVGQTRVLVPEGQPTGVTSRLDVGEIRVFGRTVNGTDNRLDVPSSPPRAINLTIDQTVGDIEVD